VSFYCHAKPGALPSIGFVIFIKIMPGCLADLDAARVIAQKNLVLQNFHVCSIREILFYIHQIIYVLHWRYGMLLQS